MNTKLNNVLHFAYIVKTFGAHGELLIKLCPEAASIEINLEEPVFITIDGYVVPFYFKQFEAHGKHRAIVVFDDMETMSLAQELVGKTIAMESKNGTRDTNSPVVSGSSFPLLHYRVVDKEAGETGIVNGLIEIPGNPCLQVKNGKEEILIPFREEILTIDHRKKTIIAHLPEGLITLNQKS